MPRISGEGRGQRHEGYQVPGVSVCEQRDLGSWPFGYRMLTRAQDLAKDCAVAEGAGATPETSQIAQIAQSARNHLEAACEAIRLGSHPVRSLGKRSSAVDAILTHYNAAACDVLRILPAEDLTARLPSLLALAREHLPASDPTRVDIELIAKERHIVSDLERKRVVAAVRAALDASEREHLKLRSFLRQVWVVVGLLFAAALAALVLSPKSQLLCSQSGDGALVCPSFSQAICRTCAPSRLDYAIVEVAGLAGALLAATVSLRKVSGTSTPYDLPAALTFLKVVSGALTAVFGILLLNGGFAPGIKAVLETPAQIVGWAVVFGYAQQLVTGIVDQQGQAVLMSVHGPANPSDASAPQLPAEAPSPASKAPSPPTPEPGLFTKLARRIAHRREA